MANRALGAPGLSGPQPFLKSGVAVDAVGESQPLLKAGYSRWADRGFFALILACCLCALALVGLIVYALVAPLARFYFRIASCNSQRDLWLVGHLYSCPITPHLRAAFLSTLLRLDWLV